MEDNFLVIYFMSFEFVNQKIVVCHFYTLLCYVVVASDFGQIFMKYAWSIIVLECCNLVIIFQILGIIFSLEGIKYPKMGYLETDTTDPFSLLILTEKLKAAAPN